MSKRTTMYMAIVVGLLFAGLAALYFTHTAENLPSYVPGHTAGLTTKHSKHGIASLILSLASFTLAWFQSGTASTETAGLES